MYAGKFTFTHLVAEPTYGPWLFICYLLFVGMIVVNIFVALITDAYEIARKELLTKETSGETVDVFGYASDKIKSILGITDKEKPPVFKDELKFAYIEGASC